MMDIYRALEMILDEVPDGMFVTAGDVASALGDPVASRVIPSIARKIGRSHLIVRAEELRSSSHQSHIGHEDAVRDASLQGVTHPLPTPVKHERKQLKGEASETHEGTSRHDRLIFRELPAIPVLRQLRNEQMELAKRVCLQDAWTDRGTVGRDRRMRQLSYYPEREHGGLFPHESVDAEAVIFGADVAYFEIDGEEWGVGVLVELDSSLEVVDFRHHVGRVKFPYIPTYLSYRELPLLEPLLKGLNEGVVFVDGNGILHPLGIGIASHAGVKCSIPTVGCAKRLLLGGPSAGDTIWSIMVGSRHVGWGLVPDDPEVLIRKLRMRGGSGFPSTRERPATENRQSAASCTGSLRKPRYISPGHLVSITGALHLAMKSLRKERVWKVWPTFAAHRECARLKREIAKA